MKKIILAVLFVLLVMPVGAQTLNCGVEYTTESVRQIAFDGIAYKINKDEYINPNMSDPNSTMNQYALKNGITFPDRELQEFKAKGFKAYSVTYKASPYYSFIYLSPINSLIFIDITENKNSFPCKTLKYDYKGNLYSVWVNVDYRDNYGYDKNGNLISHCKDDLCYNNSGKVVGARRVINPSD